MKLRNDKSVILNLEIIDQYKDFYKILVSYYQHKAVIAFSPKTKALVFIDDNQLADFLKKNEYQIRKLLHNKKDTTYYIGFKLRFVIKDEKQVKCFNNLENIIVLDKRNGKNISYPTNKAEQNIYEIYTDGCYFYQIGKGGYAAIIKDLKGKLNLVWGSVNKPLSSTLIELMAAIKGLEKLKHIEKIRIITDSRYVIKGLTEWVENWKLNDWHTVQGRKVKNIEFWKKFDQLTDGKYIEFQWIKAHSNHFENTLVDMYARLAAEKAKSYQFSQ